LTSSGIQLLIQVFLEVPDGHAEALARNEHILDVLRLAQRLGIVFDSPTVLLERGGSDRSLPHDGNAEPRVAVSSKSP
jgi:hypothetical protein